MPVFANDTEGVETNNLFKKVACKIAEWKSKPT